MTDPTNTPESSPLPTGSFATRSIALCAFGLLCVTAGIFAAPYLASIWQRLVTTAQHTNSQDAAISDSDRSESSDSEVVWYQSQMHPWIIQPQPGICPVCGMDLTPVDPKRFGAELTISPMMVQQMGVRSHIVTNSQEGGIVRSVGVIAYDTSRAVDLSLHSDAWVENVSIAAIGDRVDKGQHLYDIVSQELLVAQQEYLRVQHSEKLKRASQRRMRFLGMDAQAIASLEQAGEPLESIPVHSPVNGVAISAPPPSGRRLESGDSVLELIADDQVWVEVTLFSGQLIGLKEGFPVEVVFRDGRRLEAELSHIHPALNPHTRSSHARIYVPNPDRNMVIGDFVDVYIQLPTTKPSLRIPRSAVVSTGQRDMIFIDRGRGRFEPREIEIGATDHEGNVTVLNGLVEGEKVVIAGQFLIDAESRMIEALARIINPDLKPSSGQSITDNAIPPGKSSINSDMARLLEAYSALSNALYGRDFDSAAHHFQRVQQAGAVMPETRVALQDILTALGNSLEPDGPWKKPFGELGIVMRDLIRSEGIVVESAWQVISCGMAPAPEKGIWLQRSDEEIRNPFFGAQHSMRSCYVGSESLGHESKVAATSQEALESQPIETVLESYADLSAALYVADFSAASESLNNIEKTLTTELSYQRLNDLAASLKKHLHVDGSWKEHFGQLGIELRDTIRRESIDMKAQWYVVTCGMAPAPEDGVWIQRTDQTIQNPFFGARHGMRSCHVDVSPLQVGK